MATLIGVDVGTSGTRALAVTTEGRLVAEATRPHDLLTPRPGWTEQDPLQWWEACRAALAEVAAAAGDDVVGLGLAGQMHGSVFLDAAGEVVRPALLWNDQRTASQCDEITARVGAERLLELAGNPALTGFQAPKILWLAQEEPEALRARGERAAAEGLRALHAHRRARDRRLRRLGHAAARRARARLVGGDPRRARDPARVAAFGVSRDRR